MSQANVRVSSPLGAIALALHCALRSDMVGFKCTGVEEEESNKGSFAAPIRELPKHQLVPKNWERGAKVTTDDDSPLHISLRYRKDGVGAVVCKTVQILQEGKDDIQVIMAPSKQEPSNTLVFPLEEHFNLTSFAAAKKQSKEVAPALHYKHLSVLMTNFCKAFDLGNLIDGDEDQGPTMNILPPPPPSTNSTTKLSIARNEFGNEDRAGFILNDPLRVGGRGDFHGDLLPAGGIVVGGPGGGNLMGPNHPSFFGRGEDVDFVGGGGLSMRPRFDHFGPPGGPTNNNRIPGVGPRRGGGPRRGPRHPTDGEPNHDHFRPPSNGYGMFG